MLEWAKTQQHKRIGGMVEVIRGLYIGNKQAAGDRELLRRKGVVAICAVGARTMFNDDLVYHHVSIEDNGNESMMPHFSDACTFIHVQRRRGAILVHCKGGVSRSPTMLIAYLMRHEQLSLADATQIVKLAWPAAKPREIFLQDLQVFESILAAEKENCRWQLAVSLATEEAIVDLRHTTGQLSTREQAQEECRRLLEALQSWCVYEAFGETREANADLQQAAKLAIVAYATNCGWTKLRP
eukprot:TRINITY_DN71806_c0_g1_i1.p1 TRINITY_DN71806_c0_g1~~TRINITY_DN71806_c0_g1_i1.p1  ORF type:complete len:241 (+),score=28.75 TRINITY_DN71806_c0_g1_i1:93-815(+)